MALLAGSTSSPGTERKLFEFEKAFVGANVSELVGFDVFGFEEGDLVVADGDFVGAAVGTIKGVEKDDAKKTIKMIPLRFNVDLMALSSFFLW